MYSCMLFVCKLPIKYSISQSGKDGRTAGVFPLLAYVHARDRLTITINVLKPMLACVHLKGASYQYNVLYFLANAMLVNFINLR